MKKFESESRSISTSSSVAVFITAATNLVVGLMVAGLLFNSSQGSSAERGEAVFKLCVACHGTQAQGKVTLKAPAIAGLPAWYIEAQILKFRSGGRGAHPSDIAGLRMRPMARTLYNKEDIVSVAKYVAGLIPSGSPKVNTVKGNIIAGESQYKICASCHGVGGEGMQAVGAPPLTISNDWYLLTQLRNFKSGLRGNDPMKDPTGATMRGMAAILDDQAMHDVIVYIQSLR